MKDNLAPCPFCGGKPEFRRAGRQGHYIACVGCDASSNMVTAVKDDVRDLLIETWNRRTPPPQPHAVVEDEIAIVIQSVNEWDDRTSPDDYPEHLLITSEELAEILRNFAATLEGSDNA